MNNHKLSPSQETAVESIAAFLGDPGSRQVLTLTGRAGTGKTTVLEPALRLAGVPDDGVAYVAYTGKAAQVMASKGLLGAQTLHSLLYEPVDDYDRADGRRRVRWVAVQDLAPEIRVIVADESSMIPEDILQDLLAHGRKVILVGDHRQLPPIEGRDGGGYARLLRADLELRELHRQAEGDPVVRLAEAVLEEGAAGIPERGSYCRGAIRVLSASRDWDEAIDLLAHQGHVGLAATNASREALNAGARAALGRGSYLLPRRKDRIIFRKNHRDVLAPGGVPLVNGACGEVVGGHPVPCGERLLLLRSQVLLDGASGPLEVLLNVHDYDPPTDPARWKGGPFWSEYANALTVHASQGSEWDRVLVHLTPGDLRRLRTKGEIKQMLYTAVTRARKGVVFLL